MSRCAGLQAAAIGGAQATWALVQYGNGQNAAIFRLILGGLGTIIRSSKTLAGGVVHM